MLQIALDFRGSHRRVRNCLNNIGRPRGRGRNTTHLARLAHITSLKRYRASNIQSQCKPKQSAIILMMFHRTL
jgi:hypothetical protein